MTQSIFVTAYNPEWPQIYVEEAAQIQQILGDNLLTIHHIGSTAVPGLTAKPIIDIIAVVKDQPSSLNALETIGYQFKGEYNLPFRYYFSKNSDLKFHLHIYCQDNVEIELNLLFRNYLRTHPNAVAQYQIVKTKLVQQQSSHQKNGSMFSGYTTGKYNFIQNVLKQAGFNNLRLLHCSHPIEWQEVRRLRHKYFFEPLGINDPYTWTFDHSEHVHFILYEGVNIIGYAHIQLWPDNRAALRIIVIDENHQNKGYGHHLLTQCEKWLHSQSFKILHVESRRDTEKFYRKYCFQDMPFNDPDGCNSDCQDIALAKLL